MQSRSLLMNGPEFGRVIDLPRYAVPEVIHHRNMLRGRFNQSNLIGPFRYELLADGIDGIPDNGGELLLVSCEDFPQVVSPKGEPQRQYHPIARLPCNDDRWRLMHLRDPELRFREAHECPSVVRHMGDYQAQVPSGPWDEDFLPDWAPRRTDILVLKSLSVAEGLGRYVETSKQPEFLMARELLRSSMRAHSVCYRDLLELHHNYGFEALMAWVEMMRNPRDPDAPPPGTPPGKFLREGAYVYV